jgi:hypothetical protein
VPIPGAGASRAGDAASAPEPSGGTLPPDGEPPLVEAERLPAREARHAQRIGATRAAWILAMVTDAIQWIVWPLFVAGAASPVVDVLDVLVAFVLIRLLGWHWAFLPTFVAELIPGVDLVPTWTAAVFLATRGRKRS